MSHILQTSLERIDDNALKAQLAHEWREAFGALKRHEVAAKAAAVGREAMKWLLTLAFLGGVATVLFVAPKVFVLMHHGRRLYVRNDRFRRELAYMRRKRYITVSGERDTLAVRITPTGKFWLLRKMVHALRPNQAKAKDGKLRIIVFDILRRHNQARNALREHLLRMGLEPLRESVYLARFPCEREVTFLARVWNVSGFVNIIYADAVERIG